jgi:hypothetical protein
LLASGVGFTYNNFNQNLAIATVGDKQAYSYIDAETTYNKNKFSQLSIDVPLESVGEHRLMRVKNLAHLRRIKTELFALRQLYFDGSVAK